MGQFRRIRILLACVIIAGVLSFWAGPVQAQTVVSYRTEDGWTIHGTLYLPETSGPTPVPGVVLLTELGWLNRSIYDGYIAPNLAKKGIAALSIDVRGTGSSLGKLALRKFSPKDRSKIQLDVRGAIQFLSSQNGVDARRIGIVGDGPSADYAVLEAAEQPYVRAVVLISGQLGETAKSYIKDREDIPILGIVSKKDKGSFLQMAEAYSLSTNDSSDLILAVGHGIVMFSHNPGLDEQVVAWLDRNMVGVGTETEVSFNSEDGVALHGTLHMPDGVKKGAKVPGVFLVHGAHESGHDQQTYIELASELVKTGMAVLRFEWRGGSLEKETPTQAHLLDGMSPTHAALDVKAGIAFLASQPGVDANRIGLAAGTAATQPTLRAAFNDNRIQTAVLFTAAGVPDGEAKQFLTTSGKPILAIASTEDFNYKMGKSLAEHTRQAYLLSNSKESELLLYDDAGRGSEMLKTKPELKKMVLRWFVEKLSAGKATDGRLESSQDRR